MAIKVVGQDESKPFRAICPKCRAILEYLPIDIKEYTKKDYTGDDTTIRYIKCPTCSNRIYKGLAESY